jgi:flagellar biosynthesis protein FlhB
VSEEDTHGSKTEAPSEKKKSDALEKGNTPFSREIVSFGSLLGITAGITLLLPDMAARLFSTLLIHFAAVDQFSLLSPTDAAQTLRGLMWRVSAALTPFLILMALGGVAGSLIQNVPSANLERVSVKWERLSPAKNISKIIGKEAVIEFVKTALKFAALSTLVYVALKSRATEMLSAGLREPSILPRLLLKTVFDILAPISVFIFLLAIADIVWTRVKWWNDLRMSRQELKDEHKNAEGDPLFKQHRRMIAQKRLKSRMMADVPKATMVVVNPTHYAVAMRYVAEEGGAPIVLAKGLDLVALKIREVSEDHHIPIIENKALARTLHGSCEVGEMIPPELYKAVAEVIHFIERKRQLAKSSSSNGKVL